MTIRLVIGGQFGSEGKGSVCQWLAQNEPPKVAIRTGGVNAGHTCVKDGETIKLQQFPVAALFCPAVTVYFPSGAVLNPEVFFRERELVWEHGHRGMVWVHPQACVTQEEDLKIEQSQLITASTFTGVGATRAQRCLRRATIANDDLGFESYLWDYAYKEIMWDTEVLIEATQGWGLGVNTAFYPDTTSTPVNPWQICCDADVKWCQPNIEVWCVIRTFPIRIAGNSGFLWKETTWSELRARFGNHIPTEQTTVTKKTRRVGEFDLFLVRKMLGEVWPSKLVLTFADYLVPDKDPTKLRQVMTDHEALIGYHIDYLGVGIGQLISKKELFHDFA